MMGTLGLTAIRAVGMADGRQGMVGPAHVAARRRGFSFWDRHGGKLLGKAAFPNLKAAQTRGVGSRKAGPVSSQKPALLRA